MNSILCGALLVFLLGGPNQTTQTEPKYEVDVVMGLAYDDRKTADEERHRLDLYLPHGQKDFPVLFFVHGGSWQKGSKNLYSGLGRCFASQGIGTVVINYRLSPEVQHPAHIQDVARAFAWTQRNIAKYGGRADNIFACGHSAGGHLVALLATDPSYLQAAGLGIDNIRGVIGVSGVYDVPASPNLEKVFTRDPEKCRQASPLAHVSNNHPPFLLLYADNDFTSFDRIAKDFCARLQQCGCDAELIEMKSRNHFTIVIGLAAPTDGATQAILRFVEKNSAR